MKKQADYIKRIEIKRLWGRKDISWELRPDVNILSGSGTALARDSSLSLVVCE